MFSIAENIRGFVTGGMNSWKTKLISFGEYLGTSNIRRGIFPLLFVLCMIPLTLILRKVIAVYEFKEKEARINALSFMDDLKLLVRHKIKLIH